MSASNDSFLHKKCVVVDVDNKYYLLLKKKINKHNISTPSCGASSSIGEETSCSCDKFVSEVRLFFATGTYNIFHIVSDVVDAMCAEANYRLDDEPREIFFFR